MKQNRNMLGIVFYGRTIAVAEVENTGGAIRIRHSAEFKLPDDVPLDQAAALQTQFGTFLAEHGFKSRRAAVGISTKHILSTSLKIPPIRDEQTRHQTIKLHLERKLQMDLPEIAFDYWKSPPNDNSAILALTTLKSKVAGIQSLLSALKITPVWVTGTSFGIDFVTGPGVNCNMVEYPLSVETFIFDGGHLKAVLTVYKKESGVFDAELAHKILQQIDRILWSVSTSKDDAVNFYWWSNTAAISGTSTGLNTIFGSLQRRQVKTDDAATGGLCDYAMKLAVRQLSVEAPPVNFLNGQHDEKKLVLTRQRLTRVGLFVGAIVLLICLYLYGWYSDGKMIVQYQQQLDSMNNNVQVAEQMIKQVAYARQWFTSKPVHLERLRELTLAFPQSSDIWLTSLAVDGTLNQIITGRATSEAAILDVVDKLKSNKQFHDIKLLYIRKMGKETDIMTFAINFHARGDQ